MFPKVKYKVIDNITGEDITRSRMWVLMPDGELYYLQCGDTLIHFVTAHVEVEVC